MLYDCSSYNRITMFCSETYLALPYVLPYLTSSLALPYFTLPYLTLTQLTIRITLPYALHHT